MIARSRTKSSHPGSNQQLMKEPVQVLISQFLIEPLFKSIINLICLD